VSITQKSHKQAITDSSNLVEIITQKSHNQAPLR